MTPRRPPSCPLRAFTLIELLVVIGIIAILATIALTNMLEAQTRAKVSRVKADLSAVVTALETYRTDRNAYPTYHYATNGTTRNGWSFHPGGEVTGLYASPPFSGANPLTTPIAYLTTSPKDPFGSRRSSDAPEADEYWYVNWDYALGVIPPPGNSGFPLLQKQQGTWRLHSQGPDKFGPDSDLLEGQILYDPTNGTSSRGDVVRTQKGGQH